ncbi:alpha-amylase [Methanohalophilus levihalophilus]|uniref:glycoside hydrolase family 57 protein n=1 Tax=Methanohalophilus levihalophilus TaxID=1431282 RepID=UPI001AE76AE6|nr:glycoside hydrolase family 57 protein [Methanohalophilus levihalophilus]MBP2030682.1 alpha-amylase [Methanohalophilus levihalophilus]
MQSVCVCCEVHLPWVVKWYYPREGYRSPEFETYFDQQKIYSAFEQFASDILLANEALLDSIDNGGKYTFDISGIFLEQCKWDPSIIESFRTLRDRGSVFASSPYFHSVSSLFPDDTEFREQVNMHRNRIKELFDYTPDTFINTELILSKGLGESIKDMGFKGFVSEGSENLLHGSEPAYVYGDHVPTLLRHISLSEDIEHRFSNKDWVAYPLIADKFASWIASMEGDVTTLYFKYGSIGTHHRNDGGILQFLADLPESLEKHGIDMITPEQARKKFEPKYLPSIWNKSTARYGMHNILGNHSQHLYIHELVGIGKALQEIQGGKEYEHLKHIYRCLQQSEILLEMNDENKHFGPERAVNVFSIISDLKRAILENGT